MSEHSVLENVQAAGNVLDQAASGNGSPLPGLAEIERAAELVYQSMPPTPQYRWPQIEAIAGREVWIKHENHTPLGAFKVRGGLIYMDWLAREHPAVRTVITATRGNHGQSIPFAARRTGQRVVIVVPHGNSREKNAAMRSLGAELIEHGDDFQAAVEHSIELAAEHGWHRVPSFDLKLVAGVATYALEFFRGAPPLDTVYVPIGMGTGVCGLIAARDALGLATKIVGVGSAQAPATSLSFAAGRVVEHAAQTRIADGVACRRPDDRVIGFLQAGMDRMVLVDDDAVEAAMRLYFRTTHNVAEGAGAIGLAALLQEGDAAGARAGTVLCGGNVDTEVFTRVLAGGLGQ